MNNVYSVKEKLTLILLATGAFCFGIILPDSLSNHTRLVHFSAHFGMSFLLALCFYLVCTVKIKIPKKITYAVLITATLFIGGIYKIWEIATQGMFSNYSLHEIIDLTGVMTSMSQNVSGLLAAILLIEALIERNLIMSVLKSGHLQLGPGGFHEINLGKRQPGSMKGHLQGGSLPTGSHFSPDASEN